MEVWDSWPKAVELTGKDLALPCQSTILQHAACGCVTEVFGLSGSPPNKLALIESSVELPRVPPAAAARHPFFSLRVRLRGTLRSRLES